MDTITHGIVGALIGKAFFGGADLPVGRPNDSGLGALSSPTARVAIGACTIGAIFPDIDIFAGPLAHNPLAIMEWHRGISHSMLMLPLWSALLAALSILLSYILPHKSPSFRDLYIVYAAGLASHIFLDLVTNFGTMIWSPLDDSRPAWDWIFILDLTLTSIALVPQLAAWCFRKPRQYKLRAVFVWCLLAAGAVGTYLFAAASGFGFPRITVFVVCAIFAGVLFLPAAQGAGLRWTRANWARTGLFILCVYIAACAAVHRKALQDAQQFAVTQHFSAENVAALALPPTLTHWAGLVNTPEGVWRTTFHEPGGSIESSHLYRNAPSSTYIEQAKTLRDVQVYLWFARFPVWHQRQTDDGRIIVAISDVRFVRENVANDAESAQEKTRVRKLRTRATGFTFQIIFDAAGNVISHGFKEDP
jgi:membrane-bound metal-dependent hydrolase YbcI (DUF457 family)